MIVLPCKNLSWDNDRIPVARIQGINICQGLQMAGDGEGKKSEAILMRGKVKLGQQPHPELGWEYWTSCDITVKLPNHHFHYLQNEASFTNPS